MIGNIIKNRRLYLRMTQQQLADKVFVTQPQIHKWETGKNLPSPWELQPLCDALGLDASELLTGRPSGRRHVQICDMWDKDEDKHFGILGIPAAREWVIANKDKYVIRVFYGYNVEFRKPKDDEVPHVNMP